MEKWMKSNTGPMDECGEEERKWMLGAVRFADVRLRGIHGSKR
jgi:hypothetical protein